jgi:hypothetical protein
MESKEPVVERFRQQIDAGNLGANVEPNALILDVPNRQTHLLQYWRQLDAGCFRARAGETRHQPGATWNCTQAFGRCVRSVPQRLPPRPKTDRSRSYCEQPERASR